MGVFIRGMGALLANCLQTATFVAQPRPSSSSSNFPSLHLSFYRALYLVFIPRKRFVAALTRDARIIACESFSFFLFSFFGLNIIEILVMGGRNLLGRGERFWKLNSSVNLWKFWRFFFSRFGKVATSLKQGIFENLNVRKIGLSTEIEKFEYKLYSLTD